MSCRADVAELVDAHGSGPCGRKLVEVQVLSSALPARRNAAGLFCQHRLDASKTTLAERSPLFEALQRAQ